MAAYLKQLLFAALGLALLAAAGNALVDPYGLYGTPRREGLNALKPRQVKQARIFKIVGLARQQPRIAVLGSSRTDRGIDPADPHLGAGALNLAYDRQTYDETLAIFRELLERGGNRPPEEVLIGLDFFAANAHLRPMNDKSEANYAPWRPLQLLFSSTAVADSLRSVGRRQLKPRDTVYTPQGLRIGFEAAIQAEDGHRGSFYASERYYVEDLYLPPPHCRFAFSNARDGRQPMADLAALLHLAQQRGVRLKLFISPSHARQWETLRAVGLWEQWEDWKRQLVRLNVDAARAAGQTPYPLWDFGGYDALTSEAVPPLGDRQTLMRGYFDSSHYTPALGAQVLARLHGGSGDFGELLDETSLEPRLQRVRAAREAYARAFPGEVAEVGRTVATVLKEKRCRKEAGAGA